MQRTPANDDPIDMTQDPQVWEHPDGGWSWTAFGLTPCDDEGEILIFSSEQAAWDHFHTLPIYHTLR